MYYFPQFASPSLYAIEYPQHSDLTFIYSTGPFGLGSLSPVGSFPWKTLATGFIDWREMRFGLSNQGSLYCAVLRHTAHRAGCRSSSCVSLAEARDPIPAQHASLHDNSTLATTSLIAIIAIKTIIAYIPFQFFLSQFFVAALHD